MVCLRAHSDMQKMPALSLYVLACRLWELVRALDALTGSPPTGSSERL